MWFMEPTPHGNGMYTMTDYMLMYFLPIPTRCGGTGVGHGDSPVLIGVSIGDGILPVIITAGIHLTGMEAIGDMHGIITIIIIMVIIIRITVGVEDIILMDTPTTGQAVIGEVVLLVVTMCHRGYREIHLVRGMEIPVCGEIPLRALAEWCVRMKIIGSIQYVRRESQAIEAQWAHVLR